MSAYTRVACGFYDQLEALALRRVKCLLELEDETGNQKVLNVLITDVYARAGAEYVRTDQGLEIRLDHITSVNGMRPSAYC